MMKKPEKIKRIRKAIKVVVAPSNDDMNTPVPGMNAPPASSENETALYKQAENPLGDPHKMT